MSRKSYRDRIAASKARLDEDLRAIAEANRHLNARELVAYVRHIRNVPLTDEYAAQLLGEAKGKHNAAG